MEITPTFVLVRIAIATAGAALGALIVWAVPRTRSWWRLVSAARRGRIERNDARLRAKLDRAATAGQEAGAEARAAALHAAGRRVVTGRRRQGHWTTVELSDGTAQYYCDHRPTYNRDMMAKRVPPTRSFCCGRSPRVGSVL